MQGSLVDADLLRKLSDARSFSDSDVGIVLTQSCDLLHENFEAEPYVELAVASAIPETEKKYINARHPRVLDFSISGAQGGYRTTAADLLTIPREALALGAPSNRLSIGKTDFFTLQEWRVNRFLRVARPDSFNDALSMQRKKLAKWVDRANDIVEEIRFRFDPPGELAAGQRYQVQFYLLAGGSPGDVEKLTALSRLGHDLDSLPEQCGFLSYGEYDRVAIGYLDEMTVAQYRETLAFEAGDHLSIAGLIAIRGRKPVRE